MKKNHLYMNFIFGLCILSSAILVNWGSALKNESEPEIEFESQKEHFYKLGEKSIFSMENRPAFNYQFLNFSWF